MSTAYPPPVTFLRTAKAWVLLPFVAYLFAIPSLGPGALFVPIVIMKAPMGIISYFDPNIMDAMVMERHKGLVVFIHACFWLLMMVGISGRTHLGLPWLRTIWCTLVIMLILSVSGCAVHLGPGLRSSGNWH